MNEVWKSPNTITGDAATGDRYIRRPYINEYFWNEVRKGNHILFVAPRRVGKTSIMKDLAETPPDGYYCIYQDIEGVKTRNEFYKRLFGLLLECVGKAVRAKMVLKEWWDSFGFEEVGQDGVKLKDRDIDYEEQLRKLIPELKKVNIRTVIFLDEFAEVISKLSKRGEQEAAIEILHTLREIRSDENFKNFTLVFAGSIGLEFVIKSISRTKLINDLHRVETNALTDDEATELIIQITEGATLQLSIDVINFLKSKIAHLLPYYIQLMVEEIDIVARANNVPVIDEQLVSEAFDRVLTKNKNFDDWLARLKEYQPATFGFINAILIKCAYQDQILIQEIYNLAIDPKHAREDDYMDCVEQLLHEGYLMEFSAKQYRFTSPFLQQFWKNKYPVYNG